MLSNLNSPCKKKNFTQGIVEKYTILDWFVFNNKNGHHIFRENDIYSGEQ